MCRSAFKQASRLGFLFVLRQFSLLVALIVGVILLGAILTWPTWLLLSHQAAGHYNRVQAFCTLFTGLILCLWYLRTSGGSFSENLGFRRTGRPVSGLILKSFAVGVSVIVLLEALYLWLGVRHLVANADFSAAAMARLALKALLAGALVAVLEETLFRGALQGALQQRMNVPAAVLLGSLVFATAHYLKYPEPRAGTITWSTGITLLPQALRWFKLPGIIPSLTVLFLLGVLLALSRWRRGHLYECMGFHAGLVSALKVRAYVTDFTPGARYDFLAGRYSSDLGWPAIVLLAALIAVYLRGGLGRSACTDP